MDYIIANHCFTIECKDPISFANQFRCGFPFKNMGTKCKEKCFSIFLDSPLQDWKDYPFLYHDIQSYCVFDYDNSICEFSSYQNGFLLRFDFKDNRSPLLMVSKEDDSVFLTNYSSVSQSNIEDFQFALWIAFGLATLKNKTLAIHASTIVYENHAVLFLGESGTGKSTHTQLWEKYIPDAFILNDDSPIIRIVDEVPIVFGSMWSGKTAYYKNNSYPIAAVVRIKQAKQNTIQSMNVLESLAVLYPSCPPMFTYDRRLSEKMYEILSLIISNTPVYTLHCLPDSDSVFVSFSAVFKNI